jgi:hypothetical protein
MSWFSFFQLGSRFSYWVTSFSYSAHSLHFAAFDTEPEKKIKNNPTKMAKTRRTPRPKTAKPLNKHLPRLPRSQPPERLTRRKVAAILATTPFTIV